MNRRKPEFQAIDLSAWPSVAYTEFGESARRAFERHRQALERYVAGEPIKAIEESTGVNRRQLYRWLERAVLQHPDGRPVGFRALVRYLRIAEYVRLGDVKVRGERGSGGTAGALTQLFRALSRLVGLVAAPSEAAQGLARADPHRWKLAYPPAWPAGVA